MAKPLHFLDLNELSNSDLRHIIDDGIALKASRKGLPKGTVDPETPLAGYTLATIFEFPSTRTRVSFDMAMRQLGGHTIVLNGNDMQLGRGETIADTARVLSRYVDAIMIRTDDHAKLLELAENATVPVINGLTNDSHPCQLMADVMTFEEHRGPIRGKVVTWCGDGNNMVTSWIHAAGQFGFEFRVACPEELAPDPAALAWARETGARVHVMRDAAEAVEGANCVVADTWVSMGDDAANRHNILTPYQVDSKLMARASRDAIFMHCLPAHRGEEATAEVMDGPQSVIFDEAENRLHAQKAVLRWCLGA
ncbi:MAG: ornithine carbamoyltransferase [Sneathiella sp.]|jgi:ornithine carbamoyltransferase|uniref:ornithine carbamoyltransferase n=1 Tax=Sneathiella sp. TaxID=1964365 RepID=UPI000C3C3287|nr:ornithine carbamoyltransferase [Sneathiella sp.]MAL79441.1 ornithine carbamoyltransferase [Sneathiella sp.]